MFYLYIIQSELDGSYYVGSTHDIKRRLKEHNGKSAHFTSKKKPWKVSHIEEFASKTEAIQRERYIKRMKSKKYIESLIDIQ